MTDAERISEHIRAITYQTWDAKAIEDMLADRSAYVPGSYMDQVKRLAAMLSDVRREERAACLAAIDAEIAIGLQLNAPSPVGYLRDARFRITERGTT